jgi:hypothetical protein
MGSRSFEEPAVVLQRGARPLLRCWACRRPTSKLAVTVPPCSDAARRALLVQEVRFDALAQQPAGGAVVRSSGVPEAAVGEAGEAGRELQAEEIEEREDDVAVAGGVGAVGADRRRRRG